jgi:hypothetical protein
MPPAGAALGAAEVSPQSRAQRSARARRSATPVTTGAPAGIRTCPCLVSEAANETRPPSRSTSCTARFAALVRGSSASAAAVRAPATVPRCTGTESSIPSRGSANGSSMVWISTPIWSGNVHPARSYGGAGGPPG